MAELLDLVIRNKQGVLYGDRVEGVSSKNDRGVFDVLPKHQNFISLIKESIVIHKRIREKGGSELNELLL